MPEDFENASSAVRLFCILRLAFVAILASALHRSEHPVSVLCKLLKVWIMLYYHNRTSVLLEDCHELKNSEGPVNIKGLKPAVQAAEDWQIVFADIDHIEPLQVEVAVEGLEEYMLEARRALKALEQRMIGYYSKSMLITIYFRLKGDASEWSESKMDQNCEPNTLVIYHLPIGFLSHRSSPSLGTV